MTRSLRRFKRTQGHRAERRKTRQTLLVTQDVDAHLADALDADVSLKRPGSLGRRGRFSLRDYIENRGRYRAAEAGRKFFRGSYVATEHREAFAQFLEAVVLGGVAPSEPLASRMRELMDAPRLLPAADFLHAFLDDMPEWRDRLNEWLAETKEP